MENALVMKGNRLFRVPKGWRVIVYGTGPMAEAICEVLKDSRTKRAVPGFLPATVEIVRRDNRGTVPSAAGYEIDALQTEEALHAISGLLKRVPLEVLAVEPALVDSEAFRPGKGTYRVVKRGFDVVVSGGLGILTSPLLPIIAIVIRLDSSGPVFYNQTRVGINGSHFRIHKFRTMRKDAEAGGAVYAAVRDPRVTRVGRFLRRSRLDEIPQIWNIMRGEMSLIGPRPERPENIAMLEEALPGFSIRTTVKPGLTGWAQVLFSYAGTTFETGKKLEFDLYYVRNASIALDLQILLRTIKVVLSSKGQ